MSHTSSTPVDPSADGRTWRIQSRFERDRDAGATLVDKLETGMAARLSVKPEPMVIPLASIVLAKE